MKGEGVHRKPEDIVLNRLSTFFELGNARRAMPEEGGELLKRAVGTFLGCVSAKPQWCPTTHRQSKTKKEKENSIVVTGTAHMGISMFTFCNLGPQNGAQATGNPDAI